MEKSYVCDDYECSLVREASIMVAVVLQFGRVYKARNLGWRYLLNGERERFASVEIPLMNFCEFMCFSKWLIITEGI